MVTCVKPYVRRSLVMATPAEPAPFTTTLQSSFFLPVRRRELMIPASTTIAVPCWSSWNTGILNDDSIYERIIIYVSQQLIDDYVSKGYDLACCFKQAYANQSHVLRLAATKGSRLADTIKGLDSTLRETNEYANELYQKLLFLEFLIQLNRITLHGGIEYINTFSSNKKIVEILDFLNKNLTNRISIDELADKFYMSRYHLMHTFKEETGCTIGSYITTKRLLLARDMIRDGSSVSAACDACGFGSYSSFIRAYRKQFHSTPTNT